MEFLLLQLQLCGQRQTYTKYGTLHLLASPSTRRCASHCIIFAIRTCGVASDRHAHNLGLDGW
jgi:hypothetical protein